MRKARDMGDETVARVGLGWRSRTVLLGSRARDRDGHAYPTERCDDLLMVMMSIWCAIFTFLVKTPVSGS